MLAGGSDGNFPIRIMSFGPLYWIDAQEFDPIKYFTSIEDARDQCPDEAWHCISERI
jgi:hypothetical protein